MKLKEIFDRINRYLETTLRDAVREGLIESNDPSAMARELFAFVEGVVLQAKIHNDLGMMHQLKPSVFRFLGAVEIARAR